MHDKLEAQVHAINAECTVDEFLAIVAAQHCDQIYCKLFKEGQPSAASPGG